jgi:YidC/Oxa1 family membrane protein insertase
MSATTFTTQRQLMVKGMPKMTIPNNMMLQQQKIMLYLFPVIFAISGVNFPVGVLIYWSTTNFWTWGQQYYVIKRNPTPGSPAYEELAEEARSQSKADGAVTVDGIDRPEGAETVKPLAKENNQRRMRRNAEVIRCNYVSNTIEKA